MNFTVIFKPWPFFLSTAFLCTFSALPAQTPPAAAPQSLPAPADSLLENLEGADAEKGALAARDLLAQIADLKSKSRDQYLEYLRLALDPGRVAEGGRALPVAERLISALAYTAASRQPLPPGGGELVLKLIGVGPEPLRKPVHDAVYSLAHAEMALGGSKMAAALGAMVEREKPLPAAALEEVSDILWRVDGKELVRSLIQGLSRAKGQARSDLAPYFLSLRDRLDISFATVEEWERWWEEQKDQKIEVILQSAHRQYRSRQGELWRRIFHRIESAGDPEAYLGAIADGLDLDSTHELRTAGVEALGAFPAWLKDGKFPLDKSGSPALDEPRKAALTSRGLGLVLKLFGDADGRSAPSPELKQRALVALRSYAGHLQRNPGEEGAVAAALLDRFRAIFPERAEGARASGSPMGAARGDLLELVRTAGALRLAAARPYLERILKEESPGDHRESDRREADHREGDPKDGELLAEAIGALGRVLERGVDRESVVLIMKCYRDALLAPRPRPEPGEASQKPLRDLRKACVAALNQRIAEGPLRDEVRRFYNEVLSNPEERVARVPAIIGLGILAKGGDRTSSAHLGSLLARRSEVEPAEAAAAVDALAYLGGKEALEQLLPFIEARDKPFSEHLWRKVVTILRGQSLLLLSWTFGQLEARAFQSDQPELARVILDLGDEPDLAPLLAPDRAGGANPEEFVAFWECVLCRERAAELAGNDSRAALALSALSDLLIKNVRMKSVLPHGEEELAQGRARLLKRQELKAALAREPAPPAETVARDLLLLVAPGEEPETRWRGLTWVLAQLQGLKPCPQSARVAEECATALRSEGRGTALFASIAPEARARYLKGLDALREKLKGPPGPATGN